MSNLKLVPDDPTPLEKLLLDASRNEMPSAEHKAKLRAALGIGLPLSLPPPAASASPVVPSTPLASSPLAAPVVTVAQSTTTLAKLALGLGGFALAGALWLTSGSEPAAVAPARAPVAKATHALAPVVAVPVAEAQPAASPLPPVERRAPARPNKSESSANAAEDLSEQIRLIEQARAGLAARDAKAALLALNSYSSKFPRGSFGQEATVLRIRALDQSGDLARATAMAKSFVARFPNSPHVARLKPIAERGASR